MERAAAAQVNVKVNAVLLEETQDQILPLARLAGRFPVDVRFIELMPIGYGTTLKGLTEEAALAILRRAIRIWLPQKNGGETDRLRITGAAGCKAVLASSLPIPMASARPVTACA